MRELSACAPVRSGSRKMVPSNSLRMSQPKARYGANWSAYLSTKPGLRKLTILPGCAPRRRALDDGQVGGAGGREARACLVGVGVGQAFAVRVQDDEKLAAEERG
eukprot:scaffold91652_cov38-Phaeocystis_antarctica.AAC.3